MFSLLIGVLQMKKRALIVLLPSISVLVAVTFLALGTSSLVSQSDKPDAAGLVKTMLYGDNCEVPCWFGETLQGKDFEEVKYLLSNHEFMSDVEFEYEMKGNRQTIRWEWPDDTETRLSSGGLSFEQFFEYRADGYNYVSFTNNKLTGLKVVFLIYLNELIGTWGEPELMSAGIYRSEAAALALVYEPHVRFLVDLYCQHPELSPSTPVWAYVYESPLPIYSEPNLVISWTGYNNPNLVCNFPPP